MLRPAPFTLGVCSWSLLVKNVPELVAGMHTLGLTTAQIACGDPHHASWDEGDDFPAVARASGLHFSSAMLGFAGEDYTTPDSIRWTGGFADPALRAERLDRLAWGVERTVELGLGDLTLHAGFLPPQGDPARRSFLDTLSRAGRTAEDKGVTLGFETGQETAELLRQTLVDLAAPNLKVNFDPANMLLYDMGDPIEAVAVLAPHLRSVHAKDALRPTARGQWGEEVLLGQGEVNFPRFLDALDEAGFEGSLVIERGTGDSSRRISEIAAEVAFLRRCIDERASEAF